MAAATAQQLQTGHVGLNVSDLGRSKEFYEEVLGFQVMGESHFLGDGLKLILSVMWVRGIPNGYTLSKMQFPKRCRVVRCPNDVATRSQVDNEVRR